MRRIFWILISCTVLGLGCSWFERPAATLPAGALHDVPLFKGLGTHERKVTTVSRKAQRYFDQGFAFLCAFNHDEAIRSFRTAAALDPSCAMAWWGIALANGPHINFPAVPEDRAKAAWDALSSARQHAASGTAAERALIEALGARYAMPQPQDRKPLDEAYAAAMREVWRAHPDDADVGALFAEALMDLRPWDLWTYEGTPRPGTEEILGTLENVLASVPGHPLANHLYVHAVEASPHPEKGDAAAERLRDLQPGLGHMVHMPSHIDVRRGRWAEAIEQNNKAMAADQKYRELSPRQDFYRIYMAHNYHMKTYAAMMSGRSEEAMRAITEMVAAIPVDWLEKNTGLADAFVAAPYEVLMRFGRWDEILAEREPASYLPITRAMRHYARAVAYAAKGQASAARGEQRVFLDAKAKMDPGATFAINSAADVLGVAERLLEGEILFREGKKDEGLAAMREAVQREDKLRYMEPPDWIQPTRHALGASLLEAGRFAEAESVYREDLKRLPENGWSLFGLARALEHQNRDEEAVQVNARFQKIWAKADVNLRSSCFCQPGSGLTFQHSSERHR